MKKIHLLSILLLFGINSYSQSFFIKEGKNYTKLKYQNQHVVSIPLHSDIGNSYEIGYVFPIKSAKYLHYELGLQLDEFNAYTQAPVTAVNYNLHYLGINNSLLITLSSTNTAKKRFILDFKGGLNFSKFISGNELILDQFYDLQSFPEFKTILVVGAIGLHSKVAISESVHLSFGYDRYMSFLNIGHLKNDSFSFTSNQFKVGIHFFLQKKNNNVN